MKRETLLPRKPIVLLPLPINACPRIEANAAKHICMLYDAVQQNNAISNAVQGSWHGYGEQYARRYPKGEYNKLHMVHCLNYFCRREYKSHEAKGLMTVQIKP